MNDLVFVMYNLKLKGKQSKSNEGPCDFENLSSDDEWITEESTVVDTISDDWLGVLDSTREQNESGGNEGEKDKDGEDFESHEDANNMEFDDANNEESDHYQTKASRELEIDSNDLLDEPEDINDDDDDDDDDDATGGGLDGDLNVSIDDLF